MMLRGIAMSGIEDMLPDDIVRTILTFSTAKELALFQSTSKRWAQLNTEELWKLQGERLWRSWPIYKTLAETNPDQLLAQYSSWKNYYKWIVEDYRRTELTNDCLHNLHWEFNFLPPSWSNVETANPDTQSPSYFIKEDLFISKHLERFPSLRFELCKETDVIIEPHMQGPMDKALHTANSVKARTSTTQYLDIEGFGLHVARLDNGGWLIWNELGVFFTDGTPRHGTDYPPGLQAHMQHVGSER